MNIPRVKVLFHGTEFPPGGGGIASYMLNMARALGAQGHQAVVVTSRKARLPEVDTTEAFGPVYRVYDRRDAGTPAARDIVLSLVREARPDVIEGADHLGDCALLLRERRRPPILIKAHSSVSLKVLRESHFYRPWQRLTIAAAMLRTRRTHRAERFSIENADLLCASSRRIIEEMRKQGFRLPRRVEMIPNPMIPPAPIAYTEADRPTILFVGQIAIGKGIQYLPAIFASLVREFPAAILEIVGDDCYARGLGSLKRWLQRQFAGIPGEVRFLGRIGDPELVAAYRRAWVVALPSRWDNSPTVLLEAMGHARAVVGSPHGGMSEMVEGTGGMIADPASPAFAERVAELLRDRVARQQAGASLREKMERDYSPAAVVTQYIRFLQAPGS